MRDWVQIVDVLEKSKQNKPRALVGFDGFVDEICSVVADRATNKAFKKVETITDFATRLAKYAGLSMNIELVPTQIKLGGNAPIMANCLSTLGNEIDFIGAIGKEAIHPLFKEFHDACRKCYSITEPGHTDALEFNDGKIMLGKIDTMEDINWQAIVDFIGYEKLVELTSQTELIAFNNWTLIFAMNDIIAGFTEILSQTKHKPYIYLDLTDPTKRDKQDIREALYFISELQKVSKVMLGLNKNESLIIAEVLKFSEEDLILRAKKIQQKLNIFACVIHDLKGACSGHEEGGEWVTGPYTPTPKLSTGAGDNFNAGYCYGILQGLSPEEALVTGVCTSGFYVRNSHSPNAEELISFINSFYQNKIEE